MERVEITERASDRLEKEAQESIQRIRRDFERLAEWILTHRLPRESGSHNREQPPDRQAGKS